MKTIVVEYVNPPVPSRDFDYRATLEGYEPGDLYGIGSTPEKAKGDLLEQIDGWDT